MQCRDTLNVDSYIFDYKKYHAPCQNTINIHREKFSGGRLKTSYGNTVNASFTQ